LTAAEVLAGLRALGARLHWDGTELRVLVPKGAVGKRRPPCLQQKHLLLLKWALMLEGRARMWARLEAQGRAAGHAWWTQEGPSTPQEEP
jgi:hypothetical protein